MKIHCVGYLTANRCGPFGFLYTRGLVIISVPLFRGSFFNLVNDKMVLQGVGFDNVVGDDWEKDFSESRVSKWLFITLIGETT